MCLARRLSRSFLLGLPLAALLAGPSACSGEEAQRSASSPTATDAGASGDAGRRAQADGGSGPGERDAAAGGGGEADGGPGTEPVVPDAGGNAGGSADSGAPGGPTPTEPVVPPEGDPIDPRQYCETTREMFCQYYLRCGRINAADLSTCLEIFDQSCNAVYEPRYAALVDGGQMWLSASGVAQCAAYLSDVACHEQIFDLDGGCQNVWKGRAVSRDSCGPGIEGFVCADGHTCVLNLGICGECVRTSRRGQPCGTDVGRCAGEDTCVQGVCVARGGVGQACSETAPCVLGASCVQGICERFDVVTVGEACGQTRRCPYNAVCVSGVCQAQAGLGEACAQPGQCRSGYCDAVTSRCEALKDPTQACQSSMECLSGICLQGRCEDLVSACFD